MSRTSNGWQKSVCLGCLLAIALVTVLPAQTEWTPTDGQRQTGMMADCQKMMADMKAGQEKLDDLVAKMNAATGQQKINEMAAVLTELVARQKAMHAHMTMMGHGSAPHGDSPKEQPRTGHEQHHSQNPPVLVLLATSFPAGMGRFARTTSPGRHQTHGGRGLP